jgi:cytoskeleton protein RodZ
VIEIGSTLRVVREKKNISLAQVEEITKINRRYLEALENEDYQELPDQVYSIGFLKNYARFLGFQNEEVAELTEALKNALNTPVPVNKGANGRKRNGRPGRSMFQLPNARLLRGLIAIAVVLALIVGIYQVYGNKENTEPTSFIPGSTAENAETDDSNKPTDVTPAINPEEFNQDNSPSTSSVNSGEVGPVAGLILELYVRQDRCWMSIVVDGKEEFSGTLVEGDYRKFTANEKIFIHLGNARSVEVFKNGQSVGYLGSSNTVVKQEFLINDN